jgi:hypothetical protein
MLRYRAPERAAAQRETDVLIGQQIAQSDRLCVPPDQRLDRRGKGGATSDWAWCTHATCQATG